METFGRTLLPDSAEQGLVFNTRDVTERREAQQALQEREEHFRQLIETSHDLVQTLDPQGQIVYTGRGGGAGEPRQERVPLADEPRAAHADEQHPRLRAAAGEARGLPPRPARAVDHILKAGRHLLNLINEVLDISRIEANRQHLSLEPVRVDGAARGGER
jgi:signal transduction histidine kinase